MSKIMENMENNKNEMYLWDDDTKIRTIRELWEYSSELEEKYKKLEARVELTESVDRVANELYEIREVLAHFADWGIRIKKGE